MTRTSSIDDMTFWTKSLSGEEQQQQQGNQIPDKVHLSREACISQKGIRSFLKLSRLASDDTIDQHLNNLLDRHGASRFLQQPNSNSQLCNGFIDSYLFKHWKSRSDAIQFCDDESTNLKKEIDQTATKIDGKEVDPRIDPYYTQSLKDKYAQRYQDYTNLHNWVANEKQIESIIQNRSIEVIQDRCKTTRNLRKDFENSTTK